MARDKEPFLSRWSRRKLDPARAEPAIVCGHWSTLGLRLTEQVAALDTGCVWGGALSALRLESRKLIQLPCAGHRTPGKD